MRRHMVFSMVVLLVASIGVAAERTHEIVPEDYFDLAGVGSLNVSPDGRLCAYTESRWGSGDEGRQRDLWVMDLESRMPTRLTFDGFGAGSPQWTADGRWIYFLGSDPYGDADKPPHDGSSQIWRIRPEGGTPVAVTRVEDGVGLFALSSDGSSLVYTTSEEVFDDEWKDLKKEFGELEYGHGVGNRSAIWKLDLVTWRVEQLREAIDVVLEITLSPDGEKLAMITSPDNELIFKEGWSRVDVLDVATGDLERVTGEGWRDEHPSPFGWLDNLAWAGDSQALAFTVSFDGYQAEIVIAEWYDGSSSLYEIDRPRELSVTGGLVWRGDGRTLCYQGEEKGLVRVVAHQGVRKGSSGKASIVTPGEMVVNGFAFDDTGARLIATADTTSSIGDLYEVSKAGEMTRIYRVNPQVDTWILPQISIATWTGADGDQVSGILELPPDYEKGDGPLPLIVELHGGPTASTRYRLRLWIYGRALMASRGYALLSPNYHGSTGYGDEFLTKLIGRENEIEVTDINTGIDHLIAEGLVDPERIGVMGWSNGGFLTNSMIAASPKRFKAASSGAGVLDMVIQWAIEDTPGHVINFMKGQLPWEAAEEYVEASPLYGLADAATPTIIHVGGEDPRVPTAHSRALYRALKHYLDVPVELVVYPGEGHGLSTHTNRLAKMKWDLAWFEKYLGGTDAHPSGDGQP